jgi:transcription initiation factor TFIIIB Brf1 subunit/transcription initiation factor TFIIB
MENESISKELVEALKNFDTKTKQTPAGYFDQFELDLMQKIKAQKQAPKKALILTLISGYKKYTVAASLIFAIATGLLFFNKTEKNTASLAKVELIEIESLPDELIETYVNNNELAAEVEWNTAIENEAAFLSKQ